MATITNIALNSRSLNGCILISDGNGTTIENGNITTGDINSSSLTTNNINTSLLTISGEVRCNLNGPLSIPISISSLTGLLISYGNVSNSGATDFTNFGSTYTSTQQGFRFWNKSTTQTLTNLAIIDNSQTYFKSQLVGCTAETPLSSTSVVNRSYVDSNFVDLTNNQSINGLKLFLNKLEVYNTASNAALTLRVSSGTTQQSTISQNGSTLQFLNNSSGATVTYLITGTTRLTISPTQFLLDATCFLTTNDIKSRAPTSTHSLLSDITTGSLTINSSTGSNTINGATTFSNNGIFNSQVTFNNICPISNTNATLSNHLTTQGYNDGRYIDFTTDQTISGTKRFGAIFTTGTAYSNTLGGGGDRLSIYMSSTGNILQFAPDTNSNTYRFFSKNATGTQIVSLETNYNATTINNSLISNNLTADIITGTQNIYTNNTTGTLNIGTGQTTGIINIGTGTSSTYVRSSLGVSKGILLNDVVTPFSNFCQLYPTGSGMSYIMNAGPTTASGHNFFTYNSSATQINTLRLSSTDVIVLDGLPIYVRQIKTQAPTATDHQLYTNLTTGTLTLGSSTSNIINNSYTTNNAEATFNTWVNLKFRTRIYDLNGLGNYTQMYMIGGNEFVIGPNANGDKISFYCKDATLGQLNTFISSATANTSQVAFISNGTATFNSSTTFNTSLPTSTLTPSSPTQLTTKAYVDGMPVHQILNTNNTWTGTNTYNTYLPTSTLTPSSGQQLITKTYADSNFMYKTGSINENITGEKTFQSGTFFTGSNGYFMINANMSGGTFNPASETGTIGIIGLKDQTNDKFLLTLYGSIHASVKLNFTSGVSIGFGGGSQIPNTQVLCNGTNVVIKPSLQFSGDSTIQNSAFTGAASLNGTYNLANMTIDTNGKITSLSSGLSANNTFSGFNTFSNGLTIKSTLELKDTTNTQSGIIDMGGGGILVISSNNNSGKVQINTYDSGGSSYNRLFINETECNITVPLTLNLDYTYYNPFNFNSTRLGYITSNTGSTVTLTSGTGSNSGQLNLPAGSWNICYTATITVITNTLTTLNSLEVFLADSFNADLNIIGLDVLNYYKISTISIGQKFKISASGNLTSYVNTNTQYNLRLIPNFVAGSGGLNFQGSISATRNA